MAVQVKKPGWEAAPLGKVRLRSFTFCSNSAGQLVSMFHQGDHRRNPASNPQGWWSGTSNNNNRVARVGEKKTSEVEIRCFLNDLGILRTLFQASRSQNHTFMRMREVYFSFPINVEYTMAYDSMSHHKST